MAAPSLPPPPETGSQPFMPECPSLWVPANSWRCLPKNGRQGLSGTQAGMSGTHQRAGLGQTSGGSVWKQQQAGGGLRARGAGRPGSPGCGAGRPQLAPDSPSRPRLGEGRRRPPCQSRRSTGMCMRGLGLRVFSPAFWPWVSVLSPAPPAPVVPETPLTRS